MVWVVGVEPTWSAPETDGLPHVPYPDISLKLVLLSGFEPDSQD